VNDKRICRDLLGRPRERGTKERQRKSGKKSRVPQTSETRRHNVKKKRGLGVKGGGGSRGLPRASDTNIEGKNSEPRIELREKKGLLKEPTEPFCKSRKVFLRTFFKQGTRGLERKKTRSLEEVGKYLEKTLLFEL